MSRLRILGMVILGMTLATPVFAERDPNLGLIKARQGEMQLRSYNAGPLFGMAKGQIEYDAEKAQKLADNLKMLLELDMGRAWAPDTGNDKYPGETTALPKIWTTYPEVAEYGKRYAQAVNDLSGAAGNGLDALRAEVGSLGKSCKACHDDYREKK